MKKTSTSTQTRPQDESEYLPGKAKQIFLLVAGTEPLWQRAYVTWFTSEQARTKHARWHSRDCPRSWQALTLKPGASPVSVWLLFDLSNGDGLTHRYVWVFKTKAEALAHRKEQHQKENHARLSPPQPWSVDGDVQFIRPAFENTPLFCLKSPSGELIHSTISDGKLRTVLDSFEFIVRFHKDWRSTYWKKPGAFVRAVRKAGWRVLPVRVVEIEEETKT